MRWTSVVPMLATSPASTWRVRSAPRITGLTGHELLDADGGGEEVGDGPPVTEHSGHGLDGTQTEDDGRPRVQLGPVPADDGVDGGAEGGGDEALGAPSRRRRRRRPR